MDPVVAPFAQLLTINDRLIARALDGLSDEEAWKHPGTDPNPIYWIAGHLAVYRNVLATAFGVGTELPWASQFEMKKQPDPAAGGPPLADVRATLTTLSERLASRLGSLSDAELSATTERSFPIPDKTMRGMIAFMTYHETYHVG